MPGRRGFGARCYSTVVHPARQRNILSFPNILIRSKHLHIYAGCRSLAVWAITDGHTHGTHTRMHTRTHGPLGASRRTWRTALLDTGARSADHVRHVAWAAGAVRADTAMARAHASPGPCLHSKVCLMYGCMCAHAHAHMYALMCACTEILQADSFVARMGRFIVCEKPHT